MKKGTKVATYIVRNPNGVPAGMPVIGPWKQLVWYEGDVFEPLAGMRLDRLLSRGFIEEVASG